MALYNVTHMSDMDGMGSAALLMHYHGLKKNHLAFANYSGKVFADALRFIRDIEGSGNILVLTDLGADPHNIKQLVSALSAFKRRDNIIIWLDHHPWESGPIKSIAPLCYFMVVGENMTTCGTDLVYRILCDKDTFGDSLSRLSHKSDFPREPRSPHENAQVRKLEFAIKYLGHGDKVGNPRLKAFVEDISRGKYNSPLIIRAWKSYIKEERKYMKVLESTTKIIQLKRTRLAVGFSTRLQHTAACIDMMHTHKADVAIFINTETKRCSIRADAGFDTSAFARSFNGGGHALASGFTLEGYNVDLSKEKDRQRIFSILELRIRKFYK